MRRLIPILILLGACTAPAGDEPEDLRREFPAAAEGAWVLQSPEYVIPAGTEKQLCMATTYEGPDVGIRAQLNYQTRMGHHVTLFGTTASARDVPDGTSWDCTTTEALDMTSMEPILIGGTIEYQEDGVLNAFVLPDGMAAPLENGQRVILQSHYVNVADHDVLVQDESQMELVDEDDVEVWAAPLVNTITDFTIPANSSEYSEVFDCAMEEEVNVLFVGGHLHEWGKSFKTELTTGGATSTIYEVQEWEPSLRDAPMYEQFEAGAFTLTVGDSLRTTCTWSNNEDHDLQFPQEMCVTFGMVYPARVPIICDPT